MEELLSVNGLIIFAMLPVAFNMHLCSVQSQMNEAPRFPGKILQESKTPRSMMEREPLFIARLPAAL